VVQRVGHALFLFSAHFGYRSEPGVVPGTWPAVRRKFDGSSLTSTSKDSCIERKVGGTEKGRLEQVDVGFHQREYERLRAGLEQVDVGFHQREYERLRAGLEQAYQESKLPEAPSGTAALDELLVRIRLGK
jgi:hypothetical protein